MTPYTVEEMEQVVVELRTKVQDGDLEDNEILTSGIHHWAKEERDGKIRLATSFVSSYHPAQRCYLFTVSLPLGETSRVKAEPDHACLPHTAIPGEVSPSAPPSEK